MRNTLVYIKNALIYVVIFLWKLLPDKKIGWMIIIAVLGSMYVPWYITTLSQRNTFIEQFSKLGGVRIYHAQRYFWDATEDGYGKEADNAWQDYMNSVIAWNTVNLSNSLFIYFYYGPFLRDKYEHDLLPKMVDVHNALVDLRKTGTTTINIEENIKAMKDVFFPLNNSMMVCPIMRSRIFRNCDYKPW